MHVLKKKQWVPPFCCIRENGDLSLANLNAGLYDQTQAAANQRRLVKLKVEHPYMSSHRIRQDKRFQQCLLSTPGNRSPFQV